MREDKFIVVRNRLIKSSIWPKYAGYFLDLVDYSMFRDTTIPFKDTQVPLLKGQCIVPVRFLERRWHVSKSTVQRWLKRFKKAGLIQYEVIRIPGTNDGTDRGTRVTIVNYSDYQSLDKRARRVRDADRDANRDIEEGSIKKEAAAVVASDRSTAPPTQDQVARVLSLLAGVEGFRRGPTTEEISKLAGVADRAGWPAVEARILEVARREMEKRKAPRSFNYYLTVLSDLEAVTSKPDGKELAREQSIRREQGVSELDLSKSAAHQEYQSPQQEEPERGPGFEEFKRAGVKLFGKKGLPEEGAADTED
jgi:DNA-binding MarR family transcriptional regulator